MVIDLKVRKQNVGAKLVFALLEFPICFGSSETWGSLLQGEDKLSPYILFRPQPGELHQFWLREHL